MKQFKLFLAVIVTVLMFVVHAMPSIKAQTSEPTTISQQCPLDPNLIYNVLFSADGEYLAATWQLYSVRIWNTKTGAVVATLTDEQITNARELFAFSPDNKYLITGGYAGVLILWDIMSGKKLQTLLSQKFKMGFIRTISFTPDGKSVLVTYAEGHSLWDLVSGVENTQFNVSEEAGEASEISPDGTLILTQSESSNSSISDDNIRIWDLRSGELLHTFEKVDRERRGVFSPNGKYILIPQRDSTLLVETTDYDQVHVLEPARSDWQFSSNSKYLLAAKEQGTVFLWDVETGKSLHEWKAYTGYALQPSFLDNTSLFFVKNSVENPESQTILSVVDIKSGEQLQEVKINIVIFDMQSAALSPDKTMLAISSHINGSSRLTGWDIVNSIQMHQYC